MQENMNILDKVNVEFYLLLDDYTWTTRFIKIPIDVCTGGTPSENESSTIDYVYKNVPLNKKVVMIGIYSWSNDQ